jgi:glutaredoxin
MAKAYFDKLGVKYQDVNVENDVGAAKEAVEKSGQMGVPVIDIGGTVIVGFDRPRIDDALKSQRLI